MTKVCCLVLRVLLTIGLACWVAAAPLVWVLRDGLGPDMVETKGAQAAYKFLVGWGVPALALATPRAGLAALERRLTVPPNEVDPHRARGDRRRTGL